jgi:hypothetical protein
MHGGGGFSQHDSCSRSRGKSRIVRKRAELKKVALSKEVALYLAKHVGSNADELEGALGRLKAYSSRLQAHSLLIGTDITLSYTKHVLRHFIGPPARTATVDPFHRMPFGQGSTKEANSTRQAPTAKDRSPAFRRLETLEGEKSDGFEKYWK